MSTATYDDLALRLRNAYRGAPVQPLRDGLDPVDVAGAYAVQEINTRYWEAQGRRIIGRKAGLTAKAVQVQLGVDQPDFGVLFDDMRVADGGTLLVGSCIQPKAEAEIALVLGADLPSAKTTPEEVAAAVASVHAAIEIVDSRIADWHITFADTVADNCSSAFFVLANEGKPLQGLDRPDSWLVTTDVDIWPVAPASFWLPDGINGSNPSTPSLLGKITNAFCCSAGYSVLGLRIRREYPMTTAAFQVGARASGFRLAGNLGQQHIC